MVAEKRERGEKGRERLPWEPVFLHVSPIRLFFPSSLSPTPFDARYASYKNSKFASNHKANPIGFETQISLRG